MSILLCPLHCGEPFVISCMGHVISKDSCNPLIASHLTSSESHWPNVATRNIQLKSHYIIKLEEIQKSNFRQRESTNQGKQVSNEVCADIKFEALGTL